MSKVNLEKEIKEYIIEGVRALLEIKDDLKRILANMLSKDIVHTLASEEMTIDEDAYMRITEEVLNEPKKKPIKQKGRKKIEMGKVYNFKYKNGNDKVCKTCKGLISFDDYNKETHPWPTHVDNKGIIIGAGNCLEYQE